MPGIFIPNTHGLIKLLTLILTVCPSFSCCSIEYFAPCTPEGFGGFVLLIVLVFCVMFLFYLSLSCVLYTHGCQCLCIVNSWSPLRFSLRVKFWSDGNWFVLFQTYTWYPNSVVCHGKYSYIVYMQPCMANIERQLQDNILFNPLSKRLWDKSDNLRK